MAVAKAKCFDYTSRQHIGVALHKRLTTCWQQLRKEYTKSLTIDYFHQFGAMGMYRQADQGFFRGELTEILANGEAGMAIRLLTDLGPSMGLWKYNDRSISNDQEVKAVLDALAPAAFDMAFAANRYGVAAALGQHFNCIDDNELCRSANSSLRTAIGELISLEDVHDCADQDAFWHQVFDGTFSEPD